MERDRDYSMMVTKQYAWIKYRITNVKRQRRGVKCTNIVTGESFTTDNCVEADDIIHCPKGTASKYSRQGITFRGQWRFDKL